MEVVGIVMNSYENQPDHLATAIRSCLAQRGVVVKLVVSTVVGDSAEAVAGSIDPKIVIVRGPRPNIYEQLNRGIAALGNVGWYYFFSGNDYSFPTKAAEEVGVCARTGKRVCNSDYFIVDDVLKNREHVTLPSYDYGRHMRGINFVSDCSMVKIGILRKYAPFRVQYDNYAYYDFWLRVFEGEGNVFANNHKPTWLYRICDTSKHILREKNAAEVAAYKKKCQAMLATHPGGRKRA